MPSDPDTLAVNGSRQSTKGLVDQAITSAENAATYEQPLASHGFSAEKRNELVAQTEEIKTLSASRIEKREDSKAATQTEVTSADSALELLGNFAKTAPMAIRDHGIQGVDPAAFKLKGKVRTTPAIMQKLSDVRPLVVKIDESLKPYFGGESPTTLLDNVLANLQAAQKSQETQRQGSPEATRKMNIAKGRVIELIEDLNRVAQIAFKNEPGIAARFDKSVLERARKKKSAKSDKDSPASTTVTIPTPGDSGKTD